MISKLKRISGLLLLSIFLSCCSKYQKYETRKFNLNLDFVFNEPKDSFNDKIFYYEFKKILNDSEFVYADHTVVQDGLFSIPFNDIIPKVLNDSLYYDTFKVLNNIWWIKSMNIYQIYFNPQNNYVVGQCMDTINIEDYWGHKFKYCSKLIDTFTVKKETFYGIMDYDFNSSHTDSYVSYFNPKIGYVRDRTNGPEEHSFILTVRKKYYLINKKLFCYKTIKYKKYKSKAFFNQMKSEFRVQY